MESVLGKNEMRQQVSTGTFLQCSGGEGEREENNFDTTELRVRATYPCT